MGLWTTGVMMGPICGPILGGWLTDNHSWRWVFYINVPFGIVTAIGLLTFLRESPPTGTAKLDWIGFGALSLAIGSFQMMMLDRGETLDWFSSREIVLRACVAGLAFYVFLVQFFLAPRPFLSPRLFADRNFTVGDQHLQPDAQPGQRDRHLDHRRTAAEQHPGEPRADRRRRESVQPRAPGGRARPLLGHRVGPRPGAA